MTDEPTTQAEFLGWATKWGIDRALETIRTTGDFGRPMLLGLSDDGTHHISVLGFWSNRRQQESVETLRKVVAQYRLTAVAMIFKARVAGKDGVLREAMVVLRSCRGGKPAMEVFTMDDTGIAFSEIYDDIEGVVTRFWN